MARWVGGRWEPVAGLVRSDSALLNLARRESRAVVFGVGMRNLHFYLLFVGLAGVALALRLYGLGEMAVHHDESLHGFPRVVDFGWRASQAHPADARDVPV